MEQRSLKIILLLVTCHTLVVSYECVWYINAIHYPFLFSTAKLVTDSKVSAKNDTNMTVMTPTRKRQIQKGNSPAMKRRWLNLESPSQCSDNLKPTDNCVFALFITKPCNCNILLVVPPKKLLSLAYKKDKKRRRNYENLRQLTQPNGTFFKWHVGNL